ncbi:hypothetical protein FHL15_000366 [Xylaria flabelliformis]|uniref:Rhodopsin domain-containing protein n=1 Tax=Xylaria flabelliformis TaxID=2512241 RepID=A0A553IFQ0_9PEZI|nr:hypothetical protein FHL15_000366 [Xylaria flabelliformis]
MSSPMPPVDYSDEKVGIYVVTLLLAFAATLSVSLRFWARRLMRLPWGIDDYLALIALLIQHGAEAGTIVCVELGGLGRDVRLFTIRNPNATVYFYQSIFAIEVLYALSSPIIKLSVLAFYWRIFPTRTMKVACIVLASASIAWAIVIGIVDFVQCQPLRAFWDVQLQQSPGTKCINIILFWLGNSAANCAIDLVTLILPIREVMKLHNSISRKIGICAVFLLGGVAFAASLTRTISTIVLYYVGVTNPNIVEVYVAVIGACLPTLIPVYRRLRYGDASKSSKASHSGKKEISINTIGRISNRTQRRTAGEGSFERLRNEDSFYPPDSQHTHHIDVSGNGDCRPSKDTQLDDIPLKGIIVRHEIAWSDDKSPVV